MGSYWLCAYNGKWEGDGAKRGVQLLKDNADKQKLNLACEMLENEKWDKPVTFLARVYCFIDNAHVTIKQTRLSF